MHHSGKNLFYNTIVVTAHHLVDQFDLFIGLIVRLFVCMFVCFFACSLVCRLVFYYLVSLF